MTTGCTSFWAIAHAGERPLPTQSGYAADTPTNGRGGAIEVAFRQNRSGVGWVLGPTIPLRHTSRID